jgi:hypothetical protein
LWRASDMILHRRRGRDRDQGRRRRGNCAIEANPGTLAISRDRSQFGGRCDFARPKPIRGWRRFRATEANPGVATISRDRSQFGDGGDLGAGPGSGWSRNCATEAILAEWQEPLKTGIGRSKPISATWTEFPNSFFRLKLGSKMTAVEHLTTWTDFTIEPKSWVRAKGARMPTSPMFRIQKSVARRE